MAIKTVGYIGLGNAGYGLAANLPKAGFHLIVRDADPDREQKFVEENSKSRVSSQVESGFGEADLIVTMLPNGKVVREVLLGSGGIASTLKSGTIIIDTSSSSPYDTQSLGEELKAHDLILIDSPVTQAALHDINHGAVTFMVGSDSPEAVEKAYPVLQAMGKYIFHMGKLGSGHTMKTLNNYISAASIIALNDSLVAGSKAGLDPVQMIDVLNVGTGKNFSTAYSYRTDGIPKKYASGYQLALLVKDMGITEEVFEKTQFETKLPSLVRGYLKDSLADLPATADHTECLKGWEKRADLQLKAGQPEGQTVMRGK